MKINAQSFEEFFESSTEHKETLIILDKLIQKIGPGIDRKLYNSDSMCSIGYAEIPYKTSSDPNGKCPMIAIAPQKHTANLYIMVVEEGKFLVEIYKDKLGKVSTGKSCIRIKKFEDVNIIELENILKDAFKWYESKYGI